MFDLVKEWEDLNSWECCRCDATFIGTREQLIDARWGVELANPPDSSGCYTGENSYFCPQCAQRIHAVRPDCFSIYNALEYELLNVWRDTLNDTDKHWLRSTKNGHEEIRRRWELARQLCAPLLKNTDVTPIRETSRKEKDLS